jgi:hypothetical protein
MSETSTIEQQDPAPESEESRKQDRAPEWRLPRGPVKPNVPEVEMMENIDLLLSPR